MDNLHNFLFRKMEIWCIIKYRCECTYTFLFRREKAVANQHFSLLGLIEKVGFKKIAEESHSNQ